MRQSGTEKNIKRKRGAFVQRSYGENDTIYFESAEKVEFTRFEYED